jgi:iron complex outermembrane receptor protein
VADEYATDGFRANSALSQENAFAALRWAAAGGSYLSLTATGYRTERGVAPELHIDAPRFWRYPNQARTLGVLSAGSGLITTPFGHAVVQGNAGYTRGTVHIQSFEDETFSTIDSEERGDERVSSAHVLVTHSFLFDGHIKAAFTGGRVEYEEILGVAHSFFEQNVWSSGLEVEIPVSSRVLVSGGLVNDASTTPETAGRQALPRREAWGWRAGASISALGDRGRFHASISERARFPALRELYSGALNRFEPNPSLRPETLLGVETGFSLLTAVAGSRSFNFQIVGFAHALEDGVVRTNFAGTNRFIRVNRDNIRSKGLELFGAMVPVGRGVSLSGDVLIQDVKVEDRIANVPRQVEHQPGFRANVQIGVPVPAHVNATAALRHTGRLYCMHPDNGNLVELQAETVLDVGASRAFTVRSGGGMLSTLKVMLGMDNAGDAAVYDQCGLPQPGRTIRIGFQLN